MFAWRHAVHRGPSPLPAIGRAFPNRRAEVVAGVRALRAVSSPYRAMAHFRSTTQGVWMFVPLNVLKVLSLIETPLLRGVPDATRRPLVDLKADPRDTYRCGGSLLEHRGRFAPASVRDLVVSVGSTADRPDAMSRRAFFPRLDSRTGCGAGQCLVRPSDTVSPRALTRPRLAGWM